MKKRAKQKQVFDDIGACIKSKVEKYAGATDEDGKMLYQAYLAIQTCPE